MWKKKMFTMWFQDFVTVFNQSYNCQTSHYLGRNRPPNVRLSILLFKILGVNHTIRHNKKTKKRSRIFFWGQRLIFFDSMLSRKTFATHSLIYTVVLDVWFVHDAVYSKTDYKYKYWWVQSAKFKSNSILFWSSSLVRLRMWMEFF